MASNIGSSASGNSAQCDNTMNADGPAIANAARSSSASRRPKHRKGRKEASLRRGCQQRDYLLQRQHNIDLETYEMSRPRAHIDKGIFSPRSRATLRSADDSQASRSAKETACQGSGECHYCGRQPQAAASPLCGAIATSPAPAKDCVVLLDSHAVSRPVVTATATDILDSRPSAR
jgi:hypothetical protein